MNTARKLILMADDDPDLRELMRDVLSMEGFDLEEALDGAQCLEKVQQRRPNVIFLDVDMPKINGWDVCKNLKGSPATQNIPIVMISAHAQREDKDRAMACGADHYLPKPIDVDVLLPLLKSLTDAAAS